MRRLSTAALAIFIALVFVIYMVTFTVPYDQTVVKTRFGKADPETAVIREPGLKFKLPWPIERVQSYPLQIQVLQDQPEEILLDDGNTVIVNMAVSWRITDPLDFFRSLNTIEGNDGANDALRAQMKDLRSILTRYRFDELVNTDHTQVQMEQIEAEMAAALQKQLGEIQPSYGITIERVSMGRLLYSESTAAKVNERMTATQQALAAEILAQGTAQAGTITSEANSARDIILSHAGGVAQRIRKVGDDEVAQYIAKFAENETDEDLAIFLRQIEAAEQIIGNRSTLVIDVTHLNPFNVYFMGPGEAGDVSRLNELTSADRPAPLLPAAPTADTNQGDRP